MVNPITATLIDCNLMLIGGLENMIRDKQGQRTEKFLPQASALCFSSHPSCCFQQISVTQIKIIRFSSVKIKICVVTEFFFRVVKKHKRERGEKKKERRAKLRVSNRPRCRDNSLWSRFVFRKHRSFKMERALLKLQYWLYTSIQFKGFFPPG